MKASIFSAADFASLRRQLPATSIPGLVVRIEQAFRKALGIEDFDDDAIVLATLDPKGQTNAEQVGLRVIRMCVAYREGPSGAWLDQLRDALADADPLRVAGLDARRRSREAGRKSAVIRTSVAQQRDAELVDEARKLLGKNRPKSIANVAAILSERGMGGRESIRKKLYRLL